MLSPAGWWLVTAPVDLRSGMDRLLVHVRQVLGRDPSEGDAYVFRHHRASRIKVLCADAQGVWLAVRRLQEGHFVWPRSDELAWSLSETQFAWLCAGVDWQRLSAKKGFASAL